MTVDRMSYFLDDLSAGQRFGGSARVRIDAARIKAFAGEFDPQPFHLDEHAARASIFQGLAASGWHIAALTMSLIVAGDFQLAGGFVGAGVDEVRWPQPVRPGDELRVESEVLEVRPSRSKPTQGIVRVRTTTFNQNDQVVQVSVANLVVPKRPPLADSPDRVTTTTSAVTHGSTA